MKALFYFVEAVWEAAGGGGAEGWRQYTFAVLDAQTLGEPYTYIYVYIIYYKFGCFRAPRD